MRTVRTGALAALLVASTATSALAETNAPASDGSSSVVNNEISTGKVSDITDSLNIRHVQDGSSASADSYAGTSSATLSAQAQAAAAQQAKVCDMMNALANDPAYDPALRARTAAGYKSQCVAAPGAPAGPPPPPPWVLGTQAVLRMTLPGAIPTVGPDPQANEWKMAAVGYPLWLYVPGATTQTESMTVQGYTVTLNAVRQGLSFTMGDGGSVQCSSTTPYSAGGAPGQPSPDCGYVYKKASKPGSYRIVATANWVVTWSVLGQSGTIPVTKYGGANLMVGELEAVVHS